MLFIVKQILFYLCRAKGRTLFCIIVLAHLVCIAFILFNMTIRNTVHSSQTMELFTAKQDLHFQGEGVSTKEENIFYINILIILSKLDQNRELLLRFEVMVFSLLAKTTNDQALKFYLIGDENSTRAGEDVIGPGRMTSADIEKDRDTIKVTQINIKDLIDQLPDELKLMQKHFRAGGKLAYYADPLFFISLMLHKVLPESIEKIIMLDVDLKFQADIVNLYKHFQDFTLTHVIGMAREMQPVYRHLLRAYRTAHPGTRAGEPPPNGLTGFNSGVMLLNLKQMRNSKQYNSVLDATYIQGLVVKYNFKGHLGDQDFYSLISLEQEELFYILPCQWNRQLCQWWKDVLADVFDQYFNCSEPIMILHGNCNTEIP